MHSIFTIFGAKGKKCGTKKSCARWRGAHRFSKIWRRAQRYQRYGTGHKYLKDISKGTKISKMWREAQRSQRYGAGHKDLKDMAWCCLNVSRCRACPKPSTFFVQLKPYFVWRPLFSILTYGLIWNRNAGGRILFNTS